MLAIFMVAAEKGYWKTDPATIKQMGGELAQLVAKNGLPGSGHAAPNHPMWAWLAPQLDGAEAGALEVALAKARGEMLPAAAASPAAAKAGAPGQAHRAGSAKPTEQAAAQNAAANTPPPALVYELHQKPEPTEVAAVRVAKLLGALATVVALFTLGLWRGRHVSQPVRSST
jgi:cobaltochelatase CobN